MPVTSQTRTGTAAIKRGRAPETSGADKENDVPERAPRKRQRKKAKQEPEEEKPSEEPRRRLTTPDLEFDYDRSQLRDPRRTPGRVWRPRYDVHDMPPELHALRPPSPPKPKGRLNAAQEDELFGQKCRDDPSAFFHSLYICYDKGPDGSPTYDTAGFQLDYDKVADWMKPKPYSKRGAINGMKRAVDRQMSEKEQLAHAVFVDPAEALKHLKGLPWMDYLVKDKISKDLDIPIHKIGMDEIKLWEQKELPKESIADWLPTSDEDKKRCFKMRGGSSLRL
ncbi:hypothetical protein GQ53DRAFT_785420 [Thozetella sp. PMI_491]|nr:hypothetical protein GQ53DRAFT_785420 [Thozetella sp. PMI_491]